MATVAAIAMQVYLPTRSPIGPIMLDYGIPMNKASGEDKKTNGKFHFSASHGF